jgi:hypothetical protein
MVVAFFAPPAKKTSIPFGEPWQVVVVEQLAAKIGRTSLRSETLVLGSCWDEDDGEALPHAVPNTIVTSATIDHGDHGERRERLPDIQGPVA